MRFVALLVLSLAACSTLSSDDEPSSSDDKAVACGDARDCTADDQGCAQYPYEQLPARCVDICYRHDCCELSDGAWRIVVYDCTFPATDAGVDAP
ncbi:MAG TPA: hypothetical protein VL326_19265 [Kofleriaceae bacterium]|nr:hypothetical protein [Kofleriaceae bacterium]